VTKIETRRYLFYQKKSHPNSGSEQQSGRPAIIVQLWIKFLVLRVEMMIIRMGFLLACIGLLDRDKGVFAPYLKKLFVICMTAVVQIFLLRLSFVI